MREKAFHKNRFVKKLKWAGFCLLFAALLVHIIAKLWFGPAYVEMQVKRSLADSWSGPVTVGEVEFNYSGVMFLHNVRLFDLKGKEIMDAQGVTLVLCKWPSLDAPARIIDVRRFNIYLNFEDGRLSLPMKPQQQSAGPNYLENFTFRNASVSIVDGKSIVLADNVFAEFLKAGDGFNFNITSGRDDVNNLRVKGSIKNGEITIGMKLSEKTNQEQMSAVLKAAKVPPAWGCEGKINADMRVRGNISDIESLWPQGIVEFNDWTILEHQKTVARDFNGVLHVERRHISLRKFGGAIFDGYFDSSFYADIRKSGPVALGGKIRMSDVDLTEMTEFWETEKRFTRGKGYFSFRFAGDINGIDSLRGKGSIYLKDADLWRVPLIGEIFKGIGVWEYRLAGISDAYTHFSLSGMKMKIEEGRLSNTFSAIEAEPGGEIDLNNGQINIYVVGLALKGIDKIINKLPVINWIARFKDKIVRLHLKGPWSKPEIKKEPIKDVKEATIVFFKSIVESGGKITGTVKDGFEIFINGKENK